MLEDPEKYQALINDPRDRIKSEINKLVDDLVQDSVLSLKDRLYLTEKTEEVTIILLLYVPLIYTPYIRYTNLTEVSDQIAAKITPSISCN